MASSGKAGLSPFGKALVKHKASIVQELDINHAMSALWSMFSRSEELDITSAPDATAKSEIFLDTLAHKDTQCFQDFCSYLEKNLPHLLTKLAIDGSALSEVTADHEDQPAGIGGSGSGSVSSGGAAASLPPTQSLQLSLELALKERDNLLREKAKAIEERDEAQRQLQAIKSDRDTTAAAAPSDQEAGMPSSPHHGGGLPAFASATLQLPAAGVAVRENGYKDANWPDKVGILDSQTIDKGNERVIWETHRIVLQKAPGCGFGIAISGGRDNPHFSGGDPAIAVSDVIKGGPAEGKLCTHDRVVSVNGHSLDNVEHAYAISILRDGGNVADLIVKRRIGPHPISAATAQFDSPVSTKVTLTKKHRREDFGLVIGHKLYVKDIRAGSLAAHSGVIREGDIILKINDVSADSLSLADARKLVEKLGRSSTDKLNLLLQPAATAPQSMPRYASSSSLHKRQNSDLDHGSGGSGSAGKAQAGSGYQQPKELTYATNMTPLSPTLHKSDYEKPRIKSYSGSSSTSTAAPGSHSVAAWQQQQLAHSWHQQHAYAAFGDYGMSKSVSYQPLRRPDPVISGDHGKRTTSTDAVAAAMALQHESMLQSSLDDTYVHATDAGSFSKSRNDMQGDIHYTSFKKEGSLGIRIAGGNVTGVFISAVQEGSSAQAEGLREGDEIVRVDGRPVSGMTRDEVFTALLAAGEQVDVATRPRHSSDRYDRFLATRGNSRNESGDLFYIRTHFTYKASAAAGHLSFAVGDVFRVIDTLVNGEVGEWAVEHLPAAVDSHVDSAADLTAISSGIIPSAARAELLAVAAATTSGGGDASASAEKDGSGATTGSSKGGIGGFFRRRSSRRTKSLSKDHWDDVVFVDGDESSWTTKFPAYERVELQKQLRFVRPVVIFGGLADVARDKLCRELPELYESPQPLAAATASAPSAAATGQGSSDAATNSAPASAGAGGSGSGSGIIHLTTIQSVMARGKHCVLDVTPGAVDRLNFAQYEPIVVLLRADSKAAVKELRERWAQGSRKSARKLYEQATRIESSFAYLLSVTLAVQPGDGGAWFQRLQAVIAQQQQMPVWMTESAARGGSSAGAATLASASGRLPGGAPAGTGTGADDILFPMSNRLSYAASPGSDLDLTRSSIYYDGDVPSDVRPGAGEGRLTRSSSDPNMARQQQLLQQAVAAGGHPEDRYYPSYYGREAAPPSAVEGRLTANVNSGLTLEHASPARSRGGYARAGDRPGAYNQDDWDALVRSAEQGRGMPSVALHQQQRRPGRQQPSSGPVEQTTELYSRPNPPFGSRRTNNTMHDNIMQASDQAFFARPAADEYAASYEGTYGSRHDDDYKVFDKTAASAELRSPQTAPATSNRSDPYRFTRLTAAPSSSHPASGSAYSRPSPAKPLSSSGTYPAGFNSTAAGLPGDDGGRRVSAYIASTYEPSAVAAAWSGQYASAQDTSALLTSSVPDDQKMNSHYRMQASSGVPGSRPYGSQRQQPQRSASMSMPPAAAPALHRDGGSGSAQRQSTAPSGAAHGMPSRASASVSQPPPPPWASAASPRTSARGTGGLVPRTTASLRGATSLFTEGPGDSSQSYANAVYMDQHEAMLSAADGGSGAGMTGSRSEDFETYRKLVAPGHFDGGKGGGSGLRGRDVSSSAPSPGSAFESYRKQPAAGGAAPSPVGSASRPQGGDSQEQQQPRELAHERGVFDESGGRLESKETGVSLYIPPGALPAGAKQEVFFRVCEQDRALLPLQERGETILSPMVMCGPEGLAFQKPVQLRLPHVASGGLDSWSLSLNAAEVSSQSDWCAVAVDGKAPQTPGMPSVALTAANSSQSNMLMVEVDHF